MNITLNMPILTSKHTDFSALYGSIPDGPLDANTPISEVFKYDPDYLKSYSKNRQKASFQIFNETKQWDIIHK